MEINKELIDKFLDVIFPLPKQFGLITLNKEDDYEEVPVNYNFIKTAIHLVDPKAMVYFGVSKMAIISPNLKDTVIKIPFNGYWEDDNWIDFFFADAEDTSDYCLSEYKKYNKLKEKNLDCFVAKTLFYGCKNGTRIFLQERIIPLIDSIEKHPSSQKSKDLAKKIIGKHSFDICDLDWFANCLDEYGQEKTQNFIYYCENEDTDIIDDLHKGNIGYRYNGNPCILDYSNFCD